MSGLTGVPPFLGGLGIAVSGLSAQRRRIDVIAMNIANAETTRTPEGGAYRRRWVELTPGDGSGIQPVGSQSRIGDIRVPRVPSTTDPVGAGHTMGDGVRVAGVSERGESGPIVYEPGHPDADEFGYVRYPNVDLTQETIDLMEARRAYEANATVFEAMKGMLRRALEI